MALTQITSNGITDGTITGTDIASNLDLADNQKLRLGTDNDLQIWHTSGYNFIDAVTGSAGFFIRGRNNTTLQQPQLKIRNDANTQDIAKFIENGAVELYHSNVKKFETSSTGVSVTGVAVINNSSSTSDVGLRVTNNSTAALSTSENLEGTTNRKLTPLMLRNGSTSANTETYLGFDAGHTSKAQWNIGVKKTASLLGDFIFNTRTGSQTSAERMRIDSSGSLLINSASSVGSNYKLQAYHANDCRMYLANTTAASSQEVNLQFAPANSVTGAMITCVSEEDFSTTGNRTARLSFTTRKDGTLSEQMRIDSSGRVLINTTGVSLSTTPMLEVKSDSNLAADFAAVFSSANASSAIGISYNTIDAINNANNANLNLATHGSIRMTIDESGKVGVGTTSPSDELTIRGSQFQTSQISIGDNGDRFRIGYAHSDGLASSTTASQIISTAGSDLFIAPASNAASEIHFFSNASSGAPTERLRINSSGQLIQRYSADPYDNRAATFQSPSGVSATYISIINTETNGQSGITFGDHAGQNAGNFDGYINYDHSNQSMAFLVNGGTERMRILNDGKVGIGTSSPATNLHLNGGTYAAPTGGIGSFTQFVISNQAAGQGAGISLLGAGNMVTFINFGDSDDENVGSIVYNNVVDSMQFYVNASQQMNIDNSGNVNIPNDGTRLRFGVHADLQIYSSGSESHIKNINNHGLIFSTNNFERWGIEGGGHFKPHANNSYDLGHPSYRIRNIYTNDLNLSNEGGSNDVDGTWGSYTIQEGAEDLFLVNKRNGKKYKFNLTEVS